MKVIAAKQQGRALPEAPEPATAPGKPVALMAALEESVAKARAARGETEAPKKKAAKKVARKMTSRKRSA